MRQFDTPDIDNRLQRELTGGNIKTHTKIFHKIHIFRDNIFRIEMKYDRTCGFLHYNHIIFLIHLKYILLIFLFYYISPY